MQVCKNQSANFRYLFGHVSLHREATWPRCIQAFAVPTTSLSITSQGGCLLKVLAAPGWGCLCGPSWEHQIYEKTTSTSLPEKHPQGKYFSTVHGKWCAELLLTTTGFTGRTLRNSKCPSLLDSRPDPFPSFYPSHPLSETEELSVQCHKSGTMELGN